MQKLAEKNKLLKDNALGKSVSIFISQELFNLTGDWEWQMKSQFVYCSEVISFPLNFEGTKAIIHPDDVIYLKDILAHLKQTEVIDLEFRIITTFGEVNRIVGKQISIAKQEIELLPWTEQYENIARQKQLETSILHSELVTILENYTDKINLAGGWYINIQTFEAWYSDNVYRIYGLHPQSLNNHFYTFSNFLHPEDREGVISAFDNAFKHKVPLHLDFRIITGDDKVKNVRLNTYWSRNKSGHEFLFGLIKDETEQESFKNQLVNLQTDLWLEKQLLALDEEEINIGHWYINLKTRKTFFSDSFYKLFGTKQPEAPTSFSYFISFIHPDDQEMVIETFQKVNQSHIPLEKEFRLIRSDGKIKFLKLKSKLVLLQNESIVLGIVQDISLIKATESRLKDHNELSSVYELINKKQEEFNISGSWIWNLKTDDIIYSDGIYSLLGYKPKSLEIDIKRFLNYIIPEDRKLFQDNLYLLKTENKETSFNFSLYSRGSKKYINACFRLIQNDEVTIFYAVFTDKSQKNELKKELGKVSFLSTSILQNIKEAIFVTDYENNITQWNSQSVKLFDKRSEEVLLKNLFDVFPYLKTKEVFSGIESVKAGEAIQFAKLNLSPLTKNVNWQMIPLNDPSSDQLNVLHVILDVNKELSLEHSLKNNKSLIENIVELSDDRIIALDKNLNYIIWNHQCEDYFNIDKSKVIGRNILEIFPGSIDRPIYSEFKSALNGESIRIDLLNNGKTEATRMYLVPLKENQIVTGVLWVIKNSAKSTILSEIQMV